jgi:diaminopimelate decarboxylase
VSYFTYRDEELCAEEVPLHHIAGKFGTSCYVYSRAAEVMVSGAEVHLIRERESIAQLIALERLLP